MQRAPGWTTCSAPSPHLMRLVLAYGTLSHAIKQSQGSGMISPFLPPSAARVVWAHGYYTDQAACNRSTSCICIASARCHSTCLSMRQCRAGRKQGPHCFGRVPCRALPTRVRTAMEPMLCHSVGRVPARTPCPSCQHASCQDSATGDSAANTGPAMSGTRPAVLICRHARLAGRGQ